MGIQDFFTISLDCSIYCVMISIVLCFVIQIEMKRREVAIYSKEMDEELAIYSKEMDEKLAMYRREADEKIADAELALWAEYEQLDMSDANSMSPWGDSVREIDCEITTMREHFSSQCKDKSVVTIPDGPFANDYHFNSKMYAVLKGLLCSDENRLILLNTEQYRYLRTDFMTKKSDRALKPDFLTTSDFNVAGHSNHSGRYKVVDCMYGAPKSVALVDTIFEGKMGENELGSNDIDGLKTYLYKMFRFNGHKSPRGFVFNSHEFCFLSLNRDYCTMNYTGRKDQRLYFSVSSANPIVAVSIYARKQIMFRQLRFWAVAHMALQSSLLQTASPVLSLRFLRRIWRTNSCELLLLVKRCRKLLSNLMLPTMYKAIMWVVFCSTHTA